MESQNGFFFAFFKNTLGIMHGPIVAQGLDGFVMLRGMNSFLQFLRSNKIIRLILAVFILCSFVALAAHHHEAGETAHDCLACRLAQLLVTVVLGWALFFISKILPTVSFFPASEPIRISSESVSCLRNRAPPFSR